MTRRFLTFRGARGVAHTSRALGEARTRAVRLPTGRVVPLAPISRKLAVALDTMESGDQPYDTPWEIAALLLPDLTDAELGELDIDAIWGLSFLACARKTPWEGPKDLLGKRPHRVVDLRGRELTVRTMTRELAREMQRHRPPHAPLGEAWTLARLVLPDATPDEIDALSIEQIARVCSIAQGL